MADRMLRVASFLALIALGAGQSINIKDEDRNRLLKTGEEVIIAAEVDFGTATILQLNAEGKSIAFKASAGDPLTLATDIVGATYELVDTEGATLAVKLVNAAKTNSVTYTWGFLSTNALNEEMSVMVSDMPEITTTTTAGDGELRTGEVVQLHCSVVYGMGMLPTQYKIEMYSTLGGEAQQNADVSLVNDGSNVMTLVYTYNYTLTQNYNGKAFTCIARLSTNTEQMLQAEPMSLNVLYAPDQLILGHDQKPGEDGLYQFLVGEQVNCSSNGNPEPENGHYSWRNENTGTTIEGPVLEITADMVQDTQQWFCAVQYWAHGEQNELTEPFEFKAYVGELPDPPSDNSVAITVSVVVVVLLLVVLGVVALLWYTKRYRPSQEAKNRNASANNTGATKVPPSGYVHKPAVNPTFNDDSIDTTQQYAVPHRPQRPPKDSPNLNNHHSYGENNPGVNPGEPDTIV